MDNRTITQHDLDNAKRLTNLWKAKKGPLGLTQLSAGTRLGFNQSMVSQLLTGAVVLNTDHILKWAQLLGVSPGDIDPRMSSLGFSSTTLRKAKVPIIAAISGADVGVFSTIEITTRMTRQVYGISVDDDSLGTFARKGSTLIVSQEEEPVTGDEVFIRVKIGDHTLNAVKQYIMTDKTKNVAIVRDIFTDQQAEYDLCIVELMDPIVAVERPAINRPVRLRPSRPAQAS
jgi:transcriptional regulator with XRE-family HTH domain